MQASLIELTQEEEEIALRTVLNSKRFLASEEHVRRLTGLVISMEQFMAELVDTEDELFEALADMIDVAGSQARELRAAFRG
ncbi:hypothetical protein ACQKP1_07625 [Allorhizobium sp. NPDC080224]|uniref:hypothetical protein n=1 Tax=Allorhizobium sp. NPDC080224 TaxID=3390547 RepID=UPI003D054AAD